MKKHKGQSTVEFALVLPLFLLVMFGTIYSGMMYHDYSTLSNIARACTREAALSATDSSNEQAKYEDIATYYENQLDNLMTSFYKKADSNPISIVSVDNGVQTTINMQLNVNGFFVEMILPPAFGVRYFMVKEPYTSNNPSGGSGGSGGS